MNKLFYSLILFLLAGCFTSANAQFVVKKSEDANIVKNKKLAVVLLKADEKLLAKAAGSIEQLEDQEQVDEINQFLKNAFAKQWSYSEEVEFISEEEAELLMENRDDAYCLLRFEKLKNYRMNNTAKSPAMAALDGALNDALVLRWLGDRRKEIAVCPVPANKSGEATLHFVVANLQNQLENASQNDITKISRLKKAVKSRTSGLQNRTLLISEELASKALLKAQRKGKVDRIYPYEVKIVSNKELNELILSDEAHKYAYFEVLSAQAEGQHGQQRYNYFVVQADDFEISYMTGKGVMGSNGLFHPNYLYWIRKAAK